MKVKEYPSSLLNAARVKFLTGYLGWRPRPIVDCVVSLTSIPPRLKTLHLTIGSLLLQDVTAKKIILWLHHDLRDSIPAKLARLQNDYFEIQFRDQYSSHRKLVFALEEMKGETIVTCDDDVMYPKQWLSALVDDHLKFPGQIIAHKCRELAFDDNGRVLPYEQWHYVDESGYSRPGLLPIGNGGVLYPAESLHADATNKNLYENLAPKADDLWFKAMSVLKGTKVRTATVPLEKPTPIAGAKGNSLAKYNIKQDGNRVQWETLSKHYGLYDLINGGEQGP